MAKDERLYKALIEIVKKRRDALLRSAQAVKNTHRECDAADYEFAAKELDAAITEMQQYCIKLECNDKPN